MNSCSILYTLSTWFLGVCYGFVLLSSAAGQFSEINIFENGESLRYTLQSKILLNERDILAKNVGFYVDGEVTISVVWGTGSQKLLKIELTSPQLHIRSRKTSSSDGFIPHSSKLDGVLNKPFLVVWNNGKIEKVLLAKGETTSLINLKKGIASLFQFQIIDGEAKETDTSGSCTVKYSSLSPINFQKTKTECESKDFRYIKNSNEILGIEVVSSRQTEYELDSSFTHLKSINSKETHMIYLMIKAELGNYVESEQILSILERTIITPLNSENIDQAIEKIASTEGLTFTQETLLTENEPSSDDLISFTKKVENLRNHLKPESIGTLKSAKIFIELVNAARSANKDEISKVLSSKKNKQILHQLYDILGYVQTTESHAAVMKKLHFDEEESIDLSERYLWSLSFCAQPNPEIITDLLKKFTTVVSIPDKVKETMILTMASMTYKLTRGLGIDSNLKIARDIEETILNNLEYAKGEDKNMYFRALKNLKSQRTLPTLLNYIKTGTLKEGVLAWKAIKSFDSKLWNDDVLITARKSFFQLDRRYDTSSRTLAADILLETDPNDELLSEFLEYLISIDPTYEVKQYVFQKIKMLADANQSMKHRVQQLIRNNSYLNNYHGISPRGLSTSLSRRFLTSSSINGSLVSVQEIKSGIVKRGLIDVVIEKENIHSELFSLGIFSGGLSSFIASNNGVEEETEEESATAGIELTVMDTQIRPFVFFNGQGELMGHVWSGTASEKTPAFQVLALLHDHLEYIRLGSGYIARIDIKGATSFDLSGKIEISLWNRNAEALVQKSAGIFISGSTSIDTMFVKSQVEFSASVEPKLDLQTDIDFSANVQLCMRLVQPEALFRHNIHKIERIPGSKHRMRISRYKKYAVPGLTYSINKKNNEMCNAIFS
ncbi:unnamed protein product [Phaedon cochleariae]|uniref:Vitellogenin domain-containing protein n=1 Tax=Phaedon cochleariae TaxID=80249 RepID=A0A9N9S893_PHACE|nr:unnamed protein product [Phaedon cochleariae]